MAALDKPPEKNISTDVKEHTAAVDHFEHIFIVTGPAGCGKTTVARHISAQLKCPYVEGDDFHPKSNVEKMAAGHPLSDADRWDWLITLKNEAVKHLHDHNAVVVTCSALKKKYRDVIRVANYEHPTVQLHFVFLKLGEEQLQERVATRIGHYMKADMVHSQMAALEIPDVQLETDVIEIDVSNSKEQVEAEAWHKVESKLAEYESLKQQSTPNRN